MHSAPALFPHADWRPSGADPHAGIDTPLGELAVAGGIDAHPLRLDAAAAYRTAGGARLWVWSGGVFRAELLRCRPRLRLPDGATVRGCEAAMWRLRADERPGECEVSCRWVDAGGRGAGAPESGESLEALSWRDGGQRVTLGTPDLGSAVHYLPDGFRVSIPLATGGSFQTHFVAAWSADLPDGQATWLAVDCAPEQVLAGIDAPDALRERRE